MRYLKENKKMLCLAFILPVFLFYLDKMIIVWLKYFHSKPGEINIVLTSIDPCVNFIAHGATLITGAFLLYMFGKMYSRKVQIAGGSLLIGLLSTGIMVQVMKHFIGRARPRLTDNLIFIGPSFKEGYDSFPSGHTALMFCLAHILSRHFPRYRLMFYLSALIVAFERVEDLAHFPSDILAGALIGTLIAKLLLVKIVCIADSPSSGNPGKNL